MRNFGIFLATHHTFRKIFIVITIVPCSVVMGLYDGGIKSIREYFTNTIRDCWDDNACMNRFLRGEK